MAAGLNAQAADRSLEEMRSAAQEILASRGMARISPNGPTVQSVSLLAQSPMTTIFGYNEGGFAIISHDDTFPAVLTYSDGNYGQMMQDRNFADYISTYEAYLEHCAAEGVAPRFINKAATFDPNGVKEIMTCRWDQGAPYNLMCPFVYKDKSGSMTDARTITGCVATAMAQILYTLYQKHGADIRLRGSKYYYYIDENQQLAFETANFANLPIVWANLRDTYSATTGHAQNMAVARLMYACGVASEMMYKTGASGTYCSTANEGLNDFFEGIKAEYSGYGIEGYYQRIYDELDAGRPVMLSGADKDNNGHCFVGDGYDKEGRIHLNLGWSGGGNTYTNFVDMGGFVQAQTVNFIYPEENDELKLSKDAPLEELKGLYATADINHPSEILEPGKWYVLYNKGRYASAYSTGLKKTIQCSHYIPTKDETEKVAPMLVRFIDKGSGYCIQTGTGDYFGTLDYGSNRGSVEGNTVVYTMGHILPNKVQKYFWFKQNGTVLDCNATGSKGIAGWGTATPTDTLGHAAWMLLPVTFSETDEMPTLGPNNFNPDHRYTLINYDGGKNYYFNLKSTSCINSKNPTEVRIVRKDGGWQMSNFANEEQIFSVKSKDYKTGNNTITGDAPLILSFEPSDEPFDLGDPILNACSKLYRICCDEGYLGTNKLALGASVLCNYGPHADRGLWLVVDQDAVDELLLEGISTPAVDEPASLAPAASSLYDLQGRRIAAPNSGSLYIQAGKKTIR